MRRRRGALISLSFFGGIVLSLLVLGIAAAYLGRLLSRWSMAFAVGASIFLFGSGLAAIFGPTLRRYVPNPEITKRGGITGAFFYGLSFTVSTLATAARPLFLFL